MSQNWSKRDEEIALCIGFLKLGARVASELRNTHAKNLPPETQPLAALVTLALESFPDLERANRAIGDLARQCGFSIEEHNISAGGHA